MGAWLTASKSIDRTIPNQTGPAWTRAIMDMYQAHEPEQVCVRVHVFGRSTPNEADKIIVSQVWSINRSIYPTNHQNLQMAASLGEVRALLRTQAQGRKELLKYCKKDLDAALNVRGVAHTYMCMHACVSTEMRVRGCMHVYPPNQPTDLPHNTQTHAHRTRSGSSPRCSPRRCTSWCWTCWPSSSTMTW